jgi:hypothetical protein
MGCSLWIDWRGPQHDVIPDGVRIISKCARGEHAI